MIQARLAHLPLALLALLPAARGQDSPAPAPLQVYLLAGQSNMVGYTSAEWVRANAPELAQARADVWCLWSRACAPLAPGAGHEVGPELSFGAEVGEASAAPVLLCKYAVGGTTLNGHWRSPSAVARAGGEIGYLYKSMIKSLYRVLADPGRYCADQAGRAFEIAGFVWFQGENDCFDGMEEHYEAGLRDLIHDVRVATGTPRLPVVVVQINDSSVWDEAGGGGPEVRAAQARVAESDDDVVLVTTLDLGEGYHYSDGDHVTIGRRAGQAMVPLARRPRATDSAAIAAARADLEELFYPGRGPRPPRPDVHLSDLLWKRASSGWGGPPRKDRSIEDRPLRVDGQTYARGIGTHAESTLVYRVPAACSRFVAVCGIDDEMGERDVCSVIFRVSIDGEACAESVTMKAQEAWHFDLALPAGAQYLRLDVLEADSGNNSDHADWVDVGFVRAR